MPDNVIIVDNLSKRYRLGVIGRQTLKDEFAYLWHRVMGRNPLEHMGKVGAGQRTAAAASQSEVDDNNDFWALRDISFRIGRGEVVGIIGRNGSGKSTLLKLLSRITEPTSGEAFIEGRVGSLLEVGTGFHPELTGRENIYMNGAILGMNKREINQRFDEIVSFSEIDQFLDTPVKRYSSGMFVRLAFAVAAHLEPDILLVDEVLAVGDVEFQKKCLGKMKDVAGQGRTVLFVSHNMGAINNLCSRALLLEKGRLVLDSTAEETTDRYLGYQVVESAIVSEEEINKRMEGKILMDFPYVRLRKISLLDKKGQSKNVFDADEPIYISLEFECLQSVPDLRLVVIIVDKNDTFIYGSQNTDDADIAPKFSNISKGIYKTGCVLPPNTFGGKTFYLNIHVLYPRNEHIVLNKILQFTVKFKGYNQHIQYGGNDWGINVWPALKWSFH
jgi:lipopolysaccharide transport system ATP-binding protein